MNKQTSGIALLAGALLLGASGVASAYSSGKFDAKSTRCSACHTGGPAPTVILDPFAGNRRTGSGFRVQAGQQTTLMMLVTTQPGKGLGFAITAGDNLQIEGNTSTGVLNQPAGRYEIPFKVTAPPASCGRVFRLTANIAAVDQNRTPSGDGTAMAATSVFIACAAASKEEAAPPRVVVPTIKPSVSPTSPALPATAGAARVMAPTGQITTPVRVSVEALRAPGGVAQLELSDVDQLDASSSPPEAHFLSRGAGSGAATIYFKQAAGYIIVDCAVHSPSDVRFTIEAGSLHIENTVPVGDGRAVTIVPRGGIVRDVQVVLKSTGRKWSFSSCDLTPVR
jgi:hypothetical protein